MLARKHLSVGFVQAPSLALILVLGLIGCASPMVSSKEELQSLGENEGVVFGSFLINVEKGEENESGWDFLKGSKAGDSEYGVSITEMTRFEAELLKALVPFKTSYKFTVKPEQEFKFVKKLPAGTYQVAKIDELGFSNAFVHLGVGFAVRPKQTTYIGRLTVLFPYRNMVGSPVGTKVTDAQEETIDSLRNEHGELVFSNIVKELMK